MKSLANWVCFSCIIALPCTRFAAAAPTPTQTVSAAIGTHAQQESGKSSPAEEPNLPPQQVNSPDEKFSVVMEPAAPGDEDSIQRMLVIREGKKEIAKKATIGFLVNAFWNETEKYVAITNRTATSGDYVWIFSLPSGECVKEPDIDLQPSDPFDFLNEAASKAIHKLANVKDDDLAHYRIIARGWTKDGNLLLTVGLNYQYRGVSDWYDYDAVVRMAGPKFELISGEARKVNAWSYSGNRTP